MSGRVTLINSVLNSLPIFFMSFYKAPRNVIKTLVSIQRNFLWGGCGEKRKIAWVKWDEVCLTKNVGGLGIKNIEMFNKALLAKWHWGLINGEDGLWVRLLKARYGLIDVSPLEIDSISRGLKISELWKILIQSGSSQISLDWSRDGLSKRLGGRQSRVLGGQMDRGKTS